MPLNLSPVRASQTAIVLLVVLIISMLVLPVPHRLLDGLVAVGICSGVLLLMVAFFVSSPLAFSTFPSLLLITTLFRIALSVATTKQILLTGHAGSIIETFGRFVVGGSLVVGLVVFLIITIVQFIVIAKGAERVSEVTARFTLDALPGKQMAIDADVRAGSLTAAQAVEKRRQLVAESQFFGSMDGAMKFVKGDAIAGIIILAVNLLGGIAIGTLVMNMPLADAARKFSVLSIGEGLVGQIPALFVALAAGIVVTRSAPEPGEEGAEGSGNDLALQIGAQLLGNSRAVTLSATVMFLFAWVPGFPAVAFILLGMALLALNAMVVTGRASASGAERQRQISGAARDGEPRPVPLREDPADLEPGPLRLEISSSLAKRLGAEALSDALWEERSLLRMEFGLPFPGLSVLVNQSLPEDGFRMVVQDLPEPMIRVPPSSQLVLGETAASAQAIVPAPAALAPAGWLGEAEAQKLAGTGVEVLPAPRVLARVVTRTLQNHSAAILGVQEVRQLLKEMEPRFADLVREAQAALPLPRLAELMAALARERVPLTDLRSLLQVVVMQGKGADPHALYESVRLALARSIVARQHSRDAQALAALRLAADFEEKLRAVLALRPDGPVLALPPSDAELAAQALEEALAATPGCRTLVIAADLRRGASRLFRSRLPSVGILSQEEIAASGAVLLNTAEVKWPAGQASGKSAVFGG
jgi:type III secretion protein V